jgi:hypothetical protein
VFVGSGVGALVVSGLLLRHGDRVSGAATVNGPLVVAEPLKDMWSSLERATCDMLQPRVQVAPREFVHGFAASCFRQGGAMGTLRAILEGKTKEYLEGFKVVPEGKQGEEGGEGGDGGESKEGAALFNGATASPVRVECSMVEPASPRPRRKGDDWLSHTVNVLSAGFISGV